MNRIIRMDETHMAQPVEPEFAAAVGEAVPDETVAVDPMHLRIVEALLFAAAEPLDESALAQSLPPETDIAALLAELQLHYESRGVNLMKVAGKWQFRTAKDLGFLLHKHAVEERRLSRAAIETLSIIAYHQPVTRAEIEDIRGVMVSKGTVDALMEVGWVRIRGRRRTPGRPVTYGTTDAFLDHFALEEIRDLPGMEDLKGAGLLSTRMPSNFSMPVPPADPEALAEDEDELTDIDLEELGLLTPRVTEE